MCSQSRSVWWCGGTTYALAWMPAVFLFLVLNLLLPNVWSRADKRGTLCTSYLATPMHYVASTHASCPFLQNLSHLTWENDNEIPYLSSCLVVVEVHEGLSLLRPFPAFSPVPGVHKSSWKGDSEVHVVRTARPLQKNQLLLPYLLFFFFFI